MPPPKLGDEKLGDEKLRPGDEYEPLKDERGEPYEPELGDE
jgi:hypothetical protein